MLTRTGKRTLVAAIGLYLAAWGFGTDVMFPIAVGLMVAPLVALVWVRTFTRPVRMRRTLAQHELVEGTTVVIGLEVRPEAGPLPARATLIDHLGDDLELRAELVRVGHRLRGNHRLEGAPRGRYRLHRAQLVLSDPFGLARAAIPVDRTDAVLVYPRVYQLDSLFTDAGAGGGDAARMLLHRASGYDLHSIRDYQHGESLRRVHWRSTARRRRLMVKELEDSPRDEAAVLLDADASGQVGRLGDTSFDVQVRAAASVLHRLAEGGQRCSLVIQGSDRLRVRLGTGSDDLGTAMAALAVVKATATRPMHVTLGDAISGGDAVDAARVYVVTSVMSPALAERLLQLAGARRDVAVVWVDAATFGAGGMVTSAESAALRLSSSGVAVIRVRAGDDLGQALSAPHHRAVAHA